MFRIHSLAPLAHRGALLPGLALVSLLASCGPGDPLASAAKRMTAIESGRPFTVPSRALEAHTGEAWNLREGTAGRFALLFFGYTHCPDICPIQMATASAAVGRLTEEERARVVQVFVTMDPQRDTPERMAEWIDAMGSSAIGVRGTTSELEELLESMGFVMPPRSSRQPLPGGGPDEYLVAHPTSLFLITPDGMGRFQYPYDRGTAGQIAEDLRTLMALDWSTGPIRIRDARIPEAPGGRLAVYARIENRGPDDALVALRADVARRESLHLMEMSGGMATMAPTASLDVPAGGTVSLETGAAHGMLEELERIPHAGEVLDVTFVFASGVEVVVPVPVVALDEIVGSE